MIVVNIIKAVIVLALLGLSVWVLVSATVFHVENARLCDSLGGHYDAWDGSGQCIKDQHILFDPRHPYEGK